MTSRSTPSKVLLVANGRNTPDGDPTVPMRRYRLARVLPEYRDEARKTGKSRRA